jgi:hypothetical protein
LTFAAVGRIVLLMTAPLNPMTTSGLVAHIRARCARAFDLPLESDFFEADYLEGEEPNTALARIYHAELEAQTEDRAALGLPAPGTDDVIDALIFG